MHRPARIFAALLWLFVPLMPRLAAQHISEPPIRAPASGATSTTLAGPQLAPQWPSFQATVLSSLDDSGAPVVRRHATDLLAQRRARAHDRGTVFMIVGGAVAVVGILADEGLLIVGGVVVAGYGLYLHL